MRRVPRIMRRSLALWLLVFIFCSTNSLAAARDDDPTRSWFDSTLAWIAKRVPKVVKSLGETLTIPPG